MRHEWSEIANRINNEIYNEAQMSGFEADEIKRKLVKEWNFDIWEVGSARARAGQQTSDIQRS